MTELVTKSVVLKAIAPQPLSAYLAALGLLRMLGTQYAHPVRGAFTPCGFELSGILAEELTEFLLERWKPSPVLTPWNNDSGFYKSTGQQKAVLEELEKNDDPRLLAIRRAITRIRGLVQGSEAPKDEAKARFIGHLRSSLPDDCLCWLDAASVVHGQEVKMLPLLGSGGNEGRLEYSGLYLRSLQATLLAADPGVSKRLLAAALFGIPTIDLIGRPGGQFDPGTAGGFNTGPGLESKDLPNNPWSFILLVEGTMVWAGTLASRQQGMATGNSMAVSPFTVRHVAAGYASAGKVEDSPQKVRAEVWMPIWNRLASLGEVERFIAEGRVEVKGRSGSPERARDSMDFADAVGSLGVDRGVTSFVRFALTKRRGDNYIALPAGKLDVSHRGEVDMLRQLDVQLDVLDGQFLRRFKGEGPPAVLDSLRRNLNEARFEVATRGGSDAMVRLIRAMGALERVLAKRDPSKEPTLPRPLGGLGTEWIAACGDSPEVRIAAALTSLGRTGGSGGFRSYIAPVSPQADWEFHPSQRSRSWFGASLMARLASVLSRRMLDTKTAGAEAAVGRNPTWGTRPVGMDEIGLLFEPAAIDEACLEELIFGLTWVKPSGVERRVGGRPSGPPVPRQYALLKLLCLPDGIPLASERLAIPTPAQLVPLLQAGRVDAAVSLGRATLQAKGLKPRQIAPLGRTDTEFGNRLAAALLIPMFQVTTLLGDALLPTSDENDLHRK